MDTQQNRAVYLPITAAYQPLLVPGIDLKRNYSLV